MVLEITRGLHDVGPVTGRQQRICQRRVQKIVVFFQGVLSIVQDQRLQRFVDVVRLRKAIASLCLVDDTVIHCTIAPVAKKFLPSVTISFLVYASQFLGFTLFVKSMEHLRIYSAISHSFTIIIGEQFKMRGSGILCTVECLLWIRLQCPQRLSTIELPVV